MLDIFRRLDLDVPNLIARALQNTFGIFEYGSFIKSEIDVLSINRDVKDSVPQTVTGAITDCDRTVGVVDVFITGRHLFEHEGAQVKRQIPDRTVVWLEEFD